MSEYSPKKYWTRLAKNFAQKDARGFAPVLHPDAPPWFNSCIDTLQERSWRRALRRCSLEKDAVILDIGCGTGRWLRRYKELGFQPAGIDAAPAMLIAGRSYGTGCPLIAAEAQLLPFREAAFHCVSSVTVIQHMPSGTQWKALKEMVRVLRPSGYLILFEIIQGQGLHVFSRTPLEWIEAVSAAGARLVSWFGQEFLPFDRTVAAVAKRFRQLVGAAPTDPLLGRSPEDDNQARKGGFLRQLYWELRKVSLKFSMWVEPVCENVCPDRWATHGIFIFQKRNSPV